MTSVEHEQLVREFLESCKDEDREKFDEVCEKYPVQNTARKKVVRRREVTVGLLGLAPSRINIPTAQRYDLETVYSDREKDQ